MGDSLDAEDQVGGSQEEANSPEQLEEEEVFCTMDHLVLRTDNLRGEKIQDLKKIFGVMIFCQVDPFTYRTPLLKL